jgi:hypothetical protein
MVHRAFRHTAVIVLLLFCGSNFVLNITQRIGYTIRAPLALPPGAHDVHEIGEGWHTFRLRIGGRERLFLRRLYPNYENTESLSEIVDPLPE